MSAQPKKERLEFRLSADDKVCIETAASLSKVSVSQFIVESARSRAQRLIEDHQRLKLTEQAWNSVIEALDNPPVPNEKLRRALARLEDDEIWQ